MPWIIDILKIILYSPIDMSVEMTDLNCCGVYNSSMGHIQYQTLNVITWKITLNNYTLQISFRNAILNPQLKRSRAPNWKRPWDF